MFCLKLYQTRTKVFLSILRDFMNTMTTLCQNYNKPQQMSPKQQKNPNSLNILKTKQKYHNVHYAAMKHTPSYMIQVHIKLSRVEFKWHQTNLLAKGWGQGASPNKLPPPSKSTANKLSRMKNTNKKDDTLRKKQVRMTSDWKLSI